MHNRFPDLFTPPFSTFLLSGLKPSSSAAADRDIREKEDNSRIVKQRGLLRVVGELEAVGVVRKEGGKGVTGELTWGALKDLVRLFPLLCTVPKVTEPRLSPFLFHLFCFFVSSSPPTRNHSPLSPPSLSPSPNTSAQSTSLPLLPRPLPTPPNPPLMTSLPSLNRLRASRRTRWCRGSRRTSSESCWWRTLRRWARGSRGCISFVLFFLCCCPSHRD